MTGKQRTATIDYLGRRTSQYIDDQLNATPAQRAANKTTFEKELSAMGVADVNNFVQRYDSVIAARDAFPALQQQYIDGKITDSYRDWETDRKSTRLNSSHSAKSRMPSSA